jgi:signal transduction histidine kinase
VAGSKLHFQASARLQRLFGRDLIPDDYSAVEELVKNAYDSNATEVTITLVRPTNGRGGMIEVRDNGIGLSPKEFARSWMWAGYSEKRGEAIPGTKRIQVGEKGIGRFAADKLGAHLVVTTKTSGAARAFSAEFDWKRFENQRKLLSQIPIPTRLLDEPLLQDDAHGTILRITRLRSAWDHKAVAQLRARLEQLLDPYVTDPQFKIVLTAPETRDSGPIVAPEVQNADFEWRLQRSKRGLAKLEVRRRAENGSGWNEWEPVDSPEKNEAGVSDFGPLRAKLFYYVNRPKKRDVAGAPSGVNIYRDGMRVEPAGSRGADWLGLLERRAKRAGHMPLVPSRLFGFVEISRRDNPGLEDATNRRAFIQGPAFDGLTTFLTSQLKVVESQLEREVAAPRWQQSSRLKTTTLIEARNKLLGDLSVGLAHELRQPLQSLQTASENIDTYLTTEKISAPELSRAAGVIQRGVQRIEKNIRLLKDIGSGKEEIEEISVPEIVTEAIDAFTERAMTKGITIAVKATPKIRVTTNRHVVLSALTNVVLNAFQALEDRAGEAKNIRIAVSKRGATTTIVVEDDGPGVAEVVRSRLFKRPTTSKREGMGVGLVLWREALRMFEGDLDCTNYEKPTRFAITLREVKHDG